ncbi:hypothetical protein FRB91_007060 [Serendipita sp. 411]|nr:hypothetical protein FRB91_007060 [Serendipita sp. 411]
MKRYEERLLEDLASNWWKIQLNPIPHIYKLPTELLLQILEYCREVPRSLGSLRLVSLRMNTLATRLAFQKICLLRDRSPSFASSLPYLMKRNSRLAHACRELEFEIGYHSLTRDLVEQRPTTRHIDIIQAEILVLTPNLRVLRVKFWSVPDLLAPTEEKTWEERFGFSRTIQALSQCRHIRKLSIFTRESWNVHAREHLIPKFWSVTDDFLTSISYKDYPDTMGNLVSKMPVFTRAKELSIGCLDDMPFVKLSAILTKHFPVLKRLIINGQIQAFSGVQPLVDATAIVALETPLDILTYQDCRTGPKWIYTIPTRQINFMMSTECHFPFLKYLLEALKSHKGIFGKPIVQKILIKMKRPSWSRVLEEIPKGELEYMQMQVQTQFPAEDPEEGLLGSIGKICFDKGIYLERQIIECEPSFDYLYALAQYLRNR